MPAPWIEFDQFAHPLRWWFRREEPPWLKDSRWSVRAFRTSLALGLIGTASGWLTILVLVVIKSIKVQLGFFGNDETESVLGPGLWFALGTLIPLSRWLGRGWFLTVLSVPASMFASFIGVWTFFYVSPIFSTSPDWIPGGKDWGMFYGGAAGALIVAIWMGHPLRKSAWLSACITMILAGLACQIFSLLAYKSALLPNFARESLEVGALFVGFQSFAAIGLGIRLWWPKRNDSR